jgi:outer membrane protein TolC
MGKIRRVGNWILLATWIALMTFDGDPFVADSSIVRAQTPEPIRAAPPPVNASRLRRLPPVERPIEMVRFVAPVDKGPSQVVRAVATQPEEVPPQKVEEPGFSIDLPTALRLADAANLQVAFAREQINVAMARVDAADVLWLPSLRGGASYNRHEGSIQDVRGVQFNTSRGAFYAGAGAGGFGAGSPAVPGVYANFHLVDALFQPLAARQFAGSRNQAAAAATNDTLLQVTLSYFELLRAGEDVVISQATRLDSQKLADLTAIYADTGAGLRSDANRAKADLALRLNDVQRSRESKRVASARLAQLLRLDPSVVLTPTEPIVAPIEIVSPDVALKELIAEGLTQRPELAENRLLVAEAAQLLRREQLAVLIPSIILGTSYGGMGAGINTSFAPFHDRLDVDAMAYWEMRNLGFGEVAARRGAQSAVRATRFRELAMMDQVAREVVEAYTQVQSRKGQMATAKMGIQAALSSHELNLERIEHAQGLPIEVLQSIQALAQARREYLRTVIEYNAAQFALYRALGWPVKSPAELEAKG